MQGMARRRFRNFAALLILLATMSPATAHEFWLEPETYTPRPGQSVPISIRIGQDFKGDSYPFIRGEFKRFVVIDAKGEKPVKGIDGDDPAVKMPFGLPGLSVLAHYSTPEPLVFQEWEKFESYLQTEGLEHIVALHRQQGKPTTGIREIYSRCAKLLMNVQGAGGADRLTGMPLELVAERNPYELGKDELLPLRLFFNGKPSAGILITAFSRADTTNRQRVRTDAEGRARIALPAAGPWLINAVHMLEPTAREKAHWMSLWASMTFARP